MLTFPLPLSPHPFAAFLWQENVFKLTGADLANREVDVIDIANDEVERKDYKPHEDPKTSALGKSKTEIKYIKLLQD